MKAINFNSENMNVMIFKTDITTWENVNRLKLLLGTNPAIAKWSVDTEDRDHVLRIIPKGEIKENEIIGMITSNGFNCEVLSD